MKPWLIILYIIACTVLGAWADASFDVGGKLLSHGLEVVQIVMLISCALIFKLRREHCLWLLFAFACWRIVGFDYMYNIFRGLEWNYIGTTSRWDLFLIRQQPGGIYFGRFIFLVAGIFVPLNQLVDE